MYTPVLQIEFVYFCTVNFLSVIFMINSALDLHHILSSQQMDKHSILNHFHFCIKISRCERYKKKKYLFLPCFSVFFFCLILVYHQESERLEIQTVEERKVIYTKRLIQIQKVCRKYGLSVENVTNSREKKILKKDYIQLLSNYTGQLSDMVDIILLLIFGMKRQIMNWKKIH